MILNDLTDALFQHLTETPPPPPPASVYTTLEKFENDIFTPKTCQIFSVHTTPELICKRNDRWRQKLSASSRCRPGYLQDVVYFEERFFFVPPSPRPRPLNVKPGAFKLFRFEERSFVKVRFLSWMTLTVGLIVDKFLGPSQHVDAALLFMSIVVFSLHSYSAMLLSRA